MQNNQINQNEDPASQPASQSGTRPPVKGSKYRLKAKCEMQAARRAVNAKLFGVLRH